MPVAVLPWLQPWKVSPDTVTGPQRAESPQVDTKAVCVEGQPSSARLAKKETKEVMGDTAMLPALGPMLAHSGSSVNECLPSVLRKDGCFEAQNHWHRMLCTQPGRALSVLCPWGWAAAMGSSPGARACWGLFICVPRAAC